MPPDLFDALRESEAKEQADRKEIETLILASMNAIRDNARGFMIQQFRKLADDERRRTGG